MTADSHLPTFDGILDSTLAELNTARNGLSEAASWLRSDWRPVGSALTPAQSAARRAVQDEIAAAKAAVDRAKEAIYRAQT